MSTTPSLAFLPWLRRGLGRSFNNIDPLAGALSNPASFIAKITVNGQSAAREVRVLGPGAVVGFDARIVRRTDPPEHGASFSPNHFAQVEFFAPDLPWLFTPGRADSHGRLRPWLVLVVVREQAGVALEHVPGRPFPVLTLAPPASAEKELPDLAESWAWAHVQVLRADPARTLATTLRDQPDAALSRLLCPRRLTARTSYIAALVPAFRAGVEAGLGRGPVHPDSHEPAWDLAALAGATVELPCYASWRFTSGAAGDFETLARALERRAVAPDLGVHRLDVSAPGGGLGPWSGAPAAATVGFCGALRAPEPAVPPRAPDHHAWLDSQIEALLTTAARRDASLTEDPLVAPPLYGARQTGATALAKGSGWPRELNLDPVLRAAAGLGARIVQRTQERWVAAAWDQAAGAREARNGVRSAELAVEVGRRWQTRLQRLGDAELVLATRGAHARLARTHGPVKEALTRILAIPGTFSATMRRLTRPNTPVGRALAASKTARTTPLGAFIEHPVVGFAATRVPAGTRAWSTALGVAPVAPKAAPASDAALGELATAVRGALRPGAAVWSRLDARAPGASARAVADAHVEFTAALYGELVALSPDLLLPGLGAIPDDSVTVVATNPAFVAAFLVGANHEMARELTWREVPIDGSATWFRRFWHRVDPAAVDIPAIDRWPVDRPLAAAVAHAQENLVLLIRGDLLRRFPATAVFAVDAEWKNGVRVARASSRVAPQFSGHLGPGVSFFGFDFTAADAKGDPDQAKARPGRFLALEQPATEPVFGLDDPAPTDFGQLPRAENGLSWAHLFASAAQLDACTHAPVAAPRRPTVAGATWGQNAAHMAELTLQRPFRALIHASILLP